MFITSDKCFNFSCKLPSLMSPKDWSFWKLESMSTLHLTEFEDLLFQLIQKVTHIFAATYIRNPLTISIQ